MKFTLIVFLALAMLACLSNAFTDPLGLRKCKTNADCGDVDCIGGFCFEVVKTPKKIDTLTAEGTPKRKGYMDPVQPKKCTTNTDCGDREEDQCNLPGDFVYKGREKQLELVSSSASAGELGLWEPKLWDPELWDPELWDPELWDTELWDPELWDPELWDPELWDPGGKIAAEGGEIGAAGGGIGAGGSGVGAGGGGIGAGGGGI
ncbi:hypothetical protein B9Z55_004886 [Caenorhabditis nigoni]|uniref:Domain of unknown function DX domain-containing protein n=1 Tax=Caenorhabditis nigoni TaxID=1611254 RepID=A0A2G5UYF0_9PELO|nr:hypothetical protein B9Z55_004886 [Caenorhabditis nigoni]